MIELVIGLVPLEILIALPDHRNRDDDDKGRPCSQGVQRRYYFDGEQDGDDKKVDIGESHELQKQRFGQETEHAVFGGADKIGLELDLVPGGELLRVNLELIRGRVLGPARAAYQIPELLQPAWLLVVIRHQIN